MYYNESVKTEFLSGIKTQQSIKGIFSRAATYEEYAGVDIGEFSDPELVSFINATCPINALTMKGYVTALKSYVVWYRNKFGIQHQTQISTRDVDLSARMRELFFKSYEDVLKEFAYYDFDSGDPLGAATTLCWYGIQPRELVNLYEKQIDIQNGLIFDIDGSIIVRELEPEALRVLQRYKAVKSATRQRGQLETWYVVDSPYFIRYLKPKSQIRDDTGKPYTASYFSYAIVRFNNDYENVTGRKSKLSITNVYYSGLFYRLHQYMMTEPDTEDRRVKLKIRNIMQVSSQVANSDLLNMYSMYKKAFQL